MMENKIATFYLPLAKMIIESWAVANWTMMGHGTFSPNGKWLVTDTYLAKDREQSIYLLNMKTDSVVTLGRFIELPLFKDGWRADIHCRWSPKGDIIGFNSTHTGSTQVYVMKVKE